MGHERRAGEPEDSKVRGKTDLEGLQRWFTSVEHSSHLAGYSDREVIEKTWRFFALDILEWFKTILRDEHGVTEFTTVNYPFDWSDMKSKMMKVFSYSFALQYVWNDLTSLNRGRISPHSILALQR